jgi:hypothetical protein
MHRLLFVGITTLLGTDASQQCAGQTKSDEPLLGSTVYYGAVGAELFRARCLE